MCQNHMNVPQIICNTAMANITHFFLIAGSDYTTASVALTFLSGSQSGATQTVDVGIIDDDIPESEEFINIQISGLSVGAALAVIAAGSGTGNITIIDMDGKLLSHLTCTYYNCAI